MSLHSPGFTQEMNSNFAEIPKEKRLALKQAGTEKEWTALMPEASVYFFKTVDSVDLPLYVFSARYTTTSPPVMILFAGGAFSKGHPCGFYRQAFDYQARGITVVLSKYRGTKSDQVPVIEAYRDGRDAVIWLRENLDKLNLPENTPIIAGGSSAGANLALALSTLEFLHEEAGNHKGKPDALLLYDVGGGASAMAPIENDPYLGPEPPWQWNWYSEERFGGNPRDLSPFHHLSEGLPQAAIFIGGREKEKHLHGAWLLWTTATRLGGKWDFHLYADMPHGSMVGSAAWQPEVYRSVIDTTLRFFRRNKFLTDSSD